MLPILRHSLEHFEAVKTIDNRYNAMLDALKKDAATYAAEDLEWLRSDIERRRQEDFAGLRSRIVDV